MAKGKQGFEDLFLVTDGSGSLYIFRNPEDGELHVRNRVDNPPIYVIRGKLVGGSGAAGKD